MRHAGLIALLLLDPAFAQSASTLTFGFTPAAQPTGLTGTYAVVADFNGDGYPDIATAAGSDTIRVALGDGKGTFGQPIESAVTPWANTLTVADLNGDGIPDLIAHYVVNTVYTGGVEGLRSTSSPNAVDVMLGNGDGTFQPPLSYPTGSATSAAFLVAGDFNGDGILDIATASAFQGDQFVRVPPLTPCSWA